jgi:hypothetical protein
LKEREFCERNSTCYVMMASFAAWCARDLNRDLLAAFPSIAQCGKEPAELLDVRTGLVFEDSIPFAQKGAFLPEARDPSNSNCNAGSLNCPCIALSSDGRKGEIAQSPGTGVCAVGLVCSAKRVCVRDESLANSTATAVIGVSWLAAAAGAAALVATAN